MSTQTIGIIGAGTMGNGITQACATSGLNVIMLDINDAALQRGLNTISTSLDRLIKREKLTMAEKDAVMARIKTTTQQADFATCDFVIEAATENLELKLKIVREVEAFMKPEAILASNTSSISITRLAAMTKRPDRVVGMHFFNPVPVMALIEIIDGLQTSAETHQKVKALAILLGKTPVTVRNNPGFVVNRILCPMMNEAIFAFSEGLATVEDIDNGMKLGCNHPIGPLALADMVGLDTLLAVMEVLYSNFNDSKYRPAPLLKEMVDAGYLGRKSGRGFYQYDGK